MFPNPSALLCSVTLSVLAGSPPAQGPLLSGSAFQVPIHEARDGAAADATLWAAGPDYKVAFGDGITFYPRVGPGAGHRPWSWRTVAVGRGAAQREPGVGRAEASPWRYELRHDGWIEAYDVLAAGVEQTFTFARLPEGHGPLVIRGAVTTGLTAAEDGEAHRELTFADGEQRPAVSYGKAFAIDARGACIPLKSAWGAGEIRITVPEEWLRTAALPVTVDPLVGGTYVAGSPGDPDHSTVRSLEVAVETESSGHGLLVAYAREFAAGDHDVYAWLCDGDWQHPVRILAEITTTYDDRSACAAYVARANRWMVGFEREYSTPVGRATTIRVYFHDRGDLTENGGVGVSIPQLNLETFRNPDLGGSLSESASPRALLVYQRDAGSGDTLHSEVVAVPIDAQTRTFLSAYAVGNGPVGTALDRERPAVNQVSQGANVGWLVAWQELDRSAAQDDWDIQATLTDGQGQKLASGLLVDGGAARHVLAPRVAGTAGEYLVAFGRSSDLAFSVVGSIGVRRVDWLPGAPAPALMAARTVSSGGSLLTPLALQGLAVDTDTDSHWALTFTRAEGLTRRSGQILRLGGSGAVTESTPLYDNSQWTVDVTAVAYDAANDRFPCAVATDQQFAATHHPVVGYLFTYPPGAVLLPYGTACGPAQIHALPPYAGNAHFGVYMTGTPALAPMVLYLGALPGALPLDAAGMPGCTFLLAPHLVLATIAGVAQNGVGHVPLALPDAPVFTGDLYFQFAYLAPGLNPAGVGVTRAIRAQVR